MDRAMGPLQTQADRAADGIIKSFDRVDDQAAQVFDRVRTASRDATEDVGVYFDVAAARIDRALDGVGDGAFSELRGDARRAADGIEEEFEEAGRDSDRALDQVDQPGRFRGVGNQAEREGDRVSRAFRASSASAGVSLGALRVRAFGAGAIIAGALGTITTAAATMGIQAAASMEQAEISFTQLLGSGQRAQAFLKQLNEFGARTPFELPGLIATSRQLLGAGQAAKDIIPTLTAVGNATGALGLQQEQFEGIMLAVTQAMNKGRLQGEELMQMQERGLPVTALLAKALGVTTKRVGELSQAGKLQSDEVLPKLFDQMQKDYGGSMIKQSRTLNGLWSTFVDTTRNVLREGFEPLIPVIKDALPVAARTLESAVRSVVGFFRGDLGPELGRVRQAWEDNGTAILGLFTHMASGRGEMDQSKTAAQSLADSLVVLTNALGDAARFGDQLALGLNNSDEALDRWGSDIHTKGVEPANDMVKSLGEWLGINQLVGFVTRDVTADLAEMGITLGHNTTTTDDATSAAEDHAAALQAEKLAVQGLSRSLDNERGAELDLRQAKLNVQVAQDRLNDLKKAGRTRSLEYRQAQISLERAQLNLTTTTDKYKGAVGKTSEAERLLASRSDALSGAQKRLDLTTFGAAKRIVQFGNDAQAAFAKLKSKSVKVKADYDTSAPRGFELLVEKGLVNRAMGGPVFGPGGTTEDRIPAVGPGGTRYRLSDEEHIVDAAAIRGLGRGSYNLGHRLLTELRGDWRAGIGRAFGGPVLSYAGMSNRPYLDRPPRFNRNLDKSIDASIAGFRQVLEDTIPILTGGSGAGFGSGSWTRAIAELRADHVPYSIVSTFRPGARTAASGSVSFHALNRAVDLAGPSLLNIWRSLTDSGPTELIYSGAPMYKSRSGWKPIGALDRITYGDHHDHVHAAYQQGAWNLTRDQLAAVHAGEMVIPADFASGLRASLSGASGGATRDMVASFNDMGADLAGEFQQMGDRIVGAVEGVDLNQPLRSWVVPWLRMHSLQLTRLGEIFRGGRGSSSGGGGSGGGGTTPARPSGGGGSRGTLSARQLSALPDSQRFAYVRSHGLPTAPSGYAWAEDYTLVRKSFFDGGGYLDPGATFSLNSSGGRERVLDPAETRIWEALERRTGTATFTVAPLATVKVEAGAVQIDARGATAQDAATIRASVEDGLFAVLQQFRTGSRP